MTMKENRIQGFGKLETRLLGGTQALEIRDFFGLFGKWKSVV